jgi:hypothetical protein
MVLSALPSCPPYPPPTTCHLLPFLSLTFSPLVHCLFLPLASFSCKAGVRDKPPYLPFLEYQSELGAHEEKAEFGTHRLFLGKAEAEAPGSDRCLCRELSVYDRQSHLFIS